MPGNQNHSSQRHRAPSTLRKMCFLPHKQPIPMDVPNPLGDPSPTASRLVLNLHIRRPTPTNKPTTQTNTTIQTHTTSPQKNPQSQILRQIHMRRRIWPANKTTTLPYASVDQRSAYTHPNTLEPRTHPLRNNHHAIRYVHNEIRHTTKTKT